MERILHFTIGKETTPLWDSCIEQARRLCPTWTIIVWKDPVDTTDFQLSHYHDRANSGAQLADLIRLDVIFKYGGVYLDSDILLQRSLEPLASLDHFFCSEDGSVLTNAAFGAASKSPLIGSLIDDLRQHEPDWTSLPHRTTGPRFFSRVLGSRQELTVLPRDSFFPYNWNENPSPAEPTAFGTHVWAHSWLPWRERLRYRLRRMARPIKRLIPSTREIRRFANRVSRSIYPPVYSSHGTIVTRTNRQVYMTLPAGDLSVTPELAMKGTYEEPLMRFLERYLKGGDIFVDVGCNVGAFALVAAKQVGRFGRVYAFDANTDVLHYLRDSMTMNWLFNITSIGAAVGDTPGQTTILIDPTALGNSTQTGIRSESTIQSDHPGLREYDKLTQRIVPVVTLDETFPLSLEVKALKIDVEGFEPEVVFGSRRLLDDQAFKFVILERAHDVAASRLTRYGEAIRLIKSCNYTQIYITRRGQITASPTGVLSRNLMFQRMQ